MAHYATIQLGVVVSKQEVHRILSRDGLTLKNLGFVPGLSKVYERQQYIAHLKVIWNYADQMVFCDAKKWLNASIHERNFKRAYAPINKRNSLEQSRSANNLTPILGRKVEVFAGICYLPLQMHKPLRSDPKRLGTVGTIAYSMTDGWNFNEDDLLDFVEFDLCPVLTPFPGPRSLVL